MPDKKPIKVVVTDDHTIIREGIKSLLERDPGLVVVGEASNGNELLELLAHTADVVLMDINMPYLDGIAAIQQVLELYPSAKVIALSMLNNMPVVEKMIQSGASDYLLKTSSKEELSSAIQLVASGTTYICSDLSLVLLDKAVSPGKATESTSSRDKLLSKRELEVLALIAEGYTNAAIAEKLFTSKRTIETHRQNIVEKTQTKNTANLIKYAIQHKLIELDEEGYG